VLDSLSRSARTRGQLESLLERKGIAAEVAAGVLDRLEEVGLVDDVGYAEAFVESRHRVRGQGGRALTFELRRRGVADAVVAQAVAALDAEREYATARRLAQARIQRLAQLTPEVKARRLAGFLARKGYSGDVVARVVREVSQLATGDDDVEPGGGWDV
jgi:regulatory protein